MFDVLFLTNVGFCIFTTSHSAIQYLNKHKKHLFPGVILFIYTTNMVFDVIIMIILNIPNTMVESFVFSTNS